MTDTHSDVDRVWSAMLDEPPPPLPTAYEALAVARASHRRRTAVAGSGLAAVVVIVAVAATMSAVSTGVAAPAPQRPASPVPTSTAPPPPPPPPQVLPPAPDRDAAHAHGARNGAILMAAVPPGYTGLLQKLSTDGPAATWYFNSGPQYGSTVDVIVTTGRADGMLSASLRGAITGLGDDICSAATTDYLSHLYPGYPASCDTVTVAGVTVRLSSAHEAERGDINRATRLLAGGLLTIEAQQGIPVHRAGDSRPPDAVATPPSGSAHTILGGWPALPAVPLTPAQLAAVAANPDLIP